MKTTIELSDDLYRQAKQIAASEGITLRQLIERGVRRELEIRRRSSGYKLPDASFDGKGVKPGITEGDWLELIYAGRGG